MNAPAGRATHDIDDVARVIAHGQKDPRRLFTIFGLQLLPRRIRRVFARTLRASLGRPPLRLTSPQRLANPVREGHAQRGVVGGVEVAAVRAAGVPGHIHVSIGHFEDVTAAGEDLVRRAGQLAERGVVVDHVEAAAEGGGHQVALALLDLELAHGDRRQAAVEVHPRLTAVDRDEGPELGAQEEQARLDVVLHDREARAVVGQAAGDHGPVGAAVRGLEHVGTEVVALEVVDHDEHLVGVVERGLDVVHEARVRHARQALDGAPGAAPVLGYLHEPVVGAHVDQPLGQRRLRDRDNVPERRGRAVLGDRVDAPHAAHDLELVAIDVARQVARNGAPAGSLVVALEEDLRAEVDAVVVVGRHVQPGVPVPAQRRAAGVRLRLDVEALPAAPVEARNHPVLQLRDDDVGVLGVDHRVESVAPEGYVPVRIAYAAAQRLRRPAQRVVVLRAAVDVVERLVVGGRDLVELGQRQVGEEVPVLAEVMSLVQPAVVAEDQMLGVVRVEGDRVMVHVHALRGEPAPRLAPVVGHLDEGVERVDAVEAVRVGVELVVVHRRARLVARGAAPVLAHVLAAEGAAVAHRRLDDRVEHVRVDRRDCHPDPPLVARRQPAVDRAPGVASVRGLVDARARPAVDHRPLVPAALPRRRVHHVRVARVEVDFVDARVLVDFEDPLPGVSAVGGAVEAALAARRPERSLRRDEDGARVVGVDRDHADVAGRLQPHVRERTPAVNRLVDAVAVSHRALAVVLAGADPEGEVVVRVERDRADRVRAVVVEDRRPGGARVARLPHVPRTGRDVPGAAVGWVDRDVGDAPRGGRRADAPPAEGGEEAGVQLGGAVVVAARAATALLGGEGGGGREGREQCRGEQGREGCARSRAA